MFRYVFHAAIGAAAAMLAFTLPASAETRTFSNPKQGGQRLDWCFNWAEGCGTQAANAWCVARGYENATSFGKAEDVPPTRLIGTGALCDQPFCDSFTYITCYRAGASTQTFANPMQGAQRLDWCFNWATGCGGQAANAWCVSKGFAAATAWGKANDIPPTRLIGTGAVCDQPFCDGFTYITCTH
jgi:hypothetical protein